MSVTMQDLRRRLLCEDVDYEDAAAFGRAALPHLAELAAGSDTVLACKAIYLASVIGDEGIVRAAVEHEDPIVRIAASAAVRNLASSRARVPRRGDG